MSYLEKDRKKFKHCTHLITRGVKDSPSDRYSNSTILWLPPETITNSGPYGMSSVVGVSVNGSRAGRVQVDEHELLLAIEADAIIITDNLEHRNRPFNIGEREVADILADAGYHFKDTENRGIWTKKPWFKIEQEITVLCT